MHPKKYRLKLTEVFPVTPTIETEEIKCGRTAISSDSDLDESAVQVDPKMQQPFTNGECSQLDVELPSVQLTNDLRRSSRKRKPPTWLSDDYVRYESSEEEEHNGEE